jgi:hypothetical protein
VVWGLLSIWVGDDKLGESVGHLCVGTSGGGSGITRWFGGGRSTRCRPL